MVSSKKKLENLLENTADLSLKRKARRIIEELNPKDGEKILEVGCGDGFYLHLLSSLGLKITLTGFDIDQNALKSAHRNLKGRNIKLIQGDLMKIIPFGNNVFDKIIMSEVAEHLGNDLKGLREVHRCLKPGGHLILTVPNWYYPFLWDPVNWIAQRIPGDLHIKSGFWAGIWNQHIRLYKPWEIKEVLEKAGFLIQKVEIQTRWCLPFNHYIINLGARMLAGRILPKNLHEEMNKFESTNPAVRSMPIKSYYKIARLIDNFNKRCYQKTGTTIFVKAIKV
jgi:SAM-dependent methyltransferase